MYLYPMNRDVKCFMGGNETRVTEESFKRRCQLGQNDAIVTLLKFGSVISKGSRGAGFRG